MLGTESSCLTAILVSRFQSDVEASKQLQPCKKSTVKWKLTSNGKRPSSRKGAITAHCAPLFLFRGYVKCTTDIVVYPSNIYSSPELLLEKDVSPITFTSVLLAITWWESSTRSSANSCHDLQQQQCCSFNPWQHLSCSDRSIW